MNVWYPAAEEAGIKALLQKLNAACQQDMHHSGGLAAIKTACNPAKAGSSQGAFLTPDKNVKSAPPTYIRVNDYTEATFVAPTAARRGALLYCRCGKMSSTPTEFPSIRRLVGMY